MAFDLRLEPWLPMRRRSGVVEWLPPFAITDRIGDNPVVALAAPRPDFEGALLEWLIGLFSVALALPEEEDWEARGERPPSPDALRNRLTALPAAFDLDGDGPRFLQDSAAIDFAGQADLPIENLLIDAAGENTQKLNKDLFVKRARVPAMGMPAAAMALITLQSYAPSGGQGHRTSMRGGGPLTTLVEPRADGRQDDCCGERPLWQLIHANLQLAAGGWALPRDWQSPRGQAAAAMIWPWLAPTIRSVGKPPRQVAPRSDAHLFQAFFGMPRRIRLAFDPDGGCCALTGREEAMVVRSYRALNYGVDYGQGLWIHPLSPHRKSKNEFWPVHPQPDGLGWKDWAGLVMDQYHGNSEQRVADCVSRHAGRFQRPYAVRAFGYDMDNMKARGWMEALLPVWPRSALASGVPEAIATAAGQMVEATRLAANLLTGAVIAASFARREDATGDFSAIKASLWAAMERPFYDRIDVAADSGVASSQAIILWGDPAFAGALRQSAGSIFDSQVDLDGLILADAERLVLARRNLMSGLSGHGKGGNALFTALGLPSPEKLGPEKPRRKRDRTAKEVVA